MVTLPLTINRSLFRNYPVVLCNRHLVYREHNISMFSVLFASLCVLDGVLVLYSLKAVQMCAGG